MRPADRLFDIIQLLRSSPRALTAAAIAERLEVSTRTIYRDIATLQASGLPIDGASGFGYVLGPGYDLPPLMFTAEEFQTIAVALDLVRRTGDRGLQEAASAVRAKIAAVLPCRPAPVAETPFYVWSGGASVAAVVCMAEVRDAIRDARKIRIDYLSRDGVPSQRIVWPLAVAYFSESTLLGTWCELRQDYRHFRTDRVQDLVILDETYPADRPGLLDGWRALQAGYETRDLPLTAS
ncbi:YafY family transcriptional regulator [Acidisoma cellulosilytica]|uniref:YafY family transcriptional regulator n=1 Tax=Acidisoma cellulosilyticum TaxID=2802395 RepID=A0A963Z303_9PROT|nr:YafY family protein [Acidisoma cellulosilyticum]MCB8881845.1 YafY family transcriptional regulator [Acidisoma cellulosilyticum]